ncbi:hypothetical protein HPB47_017218 [Ixodes persulcatus]|uniref:Uncharacterized protein n=1 Tax=Ixodes persulcatus TaxID=34615 RepID=A0AC60QPV3_IXOPE|nr:hypothetical protein HPB47_017218 [Ixodes persulcatus]
MQRLSVYVDSKLLRRPGREKLLHSVKNAKRTRKPPIDSSSSGSTDFASLWLGLQKASSLPQTANTQPAPLLPTYESSLHQGTPVSIEELFKGISAGQPKAGTNDLHPRPSVAVPAKRPSVPMPFGNAPPASALPGLPGLRMRLPPPCDAALIPDSFVESNRLLLESLGKLGPPPVEELEPQVSWQTPRMAPPFPVPTGVPGQAPSLATTEQQRHHQRMPFYHVPAPQPLYPQQRPTFFTYQQQQHHPSQPQFDPKLRFHTRPPLLNNEVLRNKAPPPQKPSTAGKVLKKDKKSGGAVPAAAVPSETSATDKNRKPPNKQNLVTLKPKPKPKLETASRVKEERSEEKVDSASFSKDVPPSDSKPKQRRSRLAVKFDNDPNAT